MPTRLSPSPWRERAGVRGNYPFDYCNADVVVSQKRATTRILFPRHPSLMHNSSQMSDSAGSPRSEPTLVVRDEATVPPPDETTLADVKQFGLWAAIASLSYVFWVVGAMEMVERLAYYGVRAVATLYATLAVSEGGLGVTMATYGWLLLFWNLVQNIIAIFTGGLSDRYGYKRTIFA